MEVTANKVTIDSGQTKLEINKDGDLRLVVPTGKKVIVDGALDNTALSETIGDIQDDIDDIIGLVYPVGAIYMSVSSTSPTTLFGGTWEQIEDTFLLCAGDSHTAGATGGAETVTLGTNEIPAHTHGSKSLEGSYNPLAWSTAGYTGIIGESGELNNQASAGSGSAFGSHTMTLNATHEHNSVGGGASHNNMPPYLAVYVWKRTA